MLQHPVGSAQFGIDSVSLRAGTADRPEEPTPTYLITNRIPDSFRPSPEGFAAWTVWFDRLGSHLEDRGNPAFTRTTLGDCGPDTALGGYTLINADNLAAAAALGESHPLITLGGSVEIGELSLINVGTHLIGQAHASGCGSDTAGRCARSTPPAIDSWACLLDQGTTRNRRSADDLSGPCSVPSLLQ